MIVLDIMAPAFQIAGVVIGSAVISKVLEKNGQGDKTFLVDIVTWCGCAYIAYENWWKLIRYTMSSFGV